MKRKNEKVPEFDEIIFANRNRSYGAYNLRKSYNSVTSISLVGALSIAVILVTLLSLSTKKSIASTGGTSIIIVMTDPVIANVVQPPEVKPPAAVTRTLANLRPVVTEDSTDKTELPPPTDVIINDVQNGSLNDSTTGIIETDPDPVIPVEVKPFFSVPEMPEFPGGTHALMKYLSDNIIYPEDARRNNIQGRVTLKFVVNADGSVDRIEIIGGIDETLNDEAIRVVKTLPKFIPGRQNGTPVPVWFTLPVVFRLDSN